MINIRLCVTYDEAVKTASEYFKNNSVVAIETEYGNKYYGKKDGAVLELLHHGEKSDNKPASTILIPNNSEQLKYKYDNFIISHIDLDTVFGIMWAGGYLKNSKTARTVSELVAYLDINGFYKFKKELLDYNNPFHMKLLAITSLMNFWKINLKTLSKDIHKLILRIRDYIILDVPEDIKKFLMPDINENIFLKNISDDSLSIPKILVTYISNISVTNRYYINNIEYDIILQYNTGSNTITLACQDEKIAEKYFGKTGVIEPLQLFFGDDAGGHKTIGGSPRDKKLQYEYLEAFLKFLKRNYFNI